MGSNSWCSVGGWWGGQEWGDSSGSAQSSGLGLGTLFPPTRGVAVPCRPLCGQAEAGPGKGPVPTEGTVLQQLRLPTPGYKRGGRGRCSRHLTRAPQGAGE